MTDVYHLKDTGSKKLSCRVFFPVNYLRSDDERVSITLDGKATGRWYGVGEQPFADGSAFGSDIESGKYYKTALENAMQILRALEREHQRVFSAALTIRRLGEALTQPRLPDKGDCMTFDFSLPASSYLEEDLSRLDRICR